jgi:hypothetical protein
MKIAKFPSLLNKPGVKTLAWLLLSLQFAGNAHHLF